MHVPMYHQNQTHLKNRMGRLSYAAWIGLLSIGGFCSVLVLWFPQFSPFNTLAPSLIFSLVIFGFCIYYWIVFSIKRLHDCDQSGLWLLFMLVPILNTLLFLYLLCAAGTKTENAFGPIQTTTTWEVWVGILSLILIMTGTVYQIIHHFLAVYQILG